MIPSPFDNAGNLPGQGFAPPTPASRIRSFVWPLVLLILMSVISVLLFAGKLAFPGLFFWFIGGDLMQLWFLVLVVLGLLYRGAIARRRKRGAGKRASLMQQSQAYYLESSFGAWPMQAQRQTSGRFVHGLLHIPLLLLAGFLVYYFFFVGYTFPVGPHPTVTGDCNAGTITVKGKTGSDALSLKAGLLTIEGYGNYDSTNNVLNLNGNLCGFSLVVPANTNLHLSGNDATLLVSGITGKIELDNNAGDITINGSALLAGSVVSNNAGKITINNSCLTSGVKVDSNGSPIIQSQVKPCDSTAGK